jgi:hypothetical protein
MFLARKTIAPTNPVKQIFAVSSIGTLRYVLSRMMMNRKMIESIIVKIRDIIDKMFKGINHGSTTIIVELHMGVIDAENDVEFIFKKILT